MMAVRERLMGPPRRLLATPLAAWERDGLKAALVKAGLPADDVDEPRLLFWRFQTYEDIPVGFGGLEIHGGDGLLRSVVTLPPLRSVGMGSAVVNALEIEARALNCRVLYLLTTAQTRFFVRLGYTPCQRDEVPAAIRASRQFASLCPASATAMTKEL
jgi:amino-acid N-acetyltransferase